MTCFPLLVILSYRIGILFSLWLGMPFTHCCQTEIFFKKILSAQWCYVSSAESSEVMSLLSRNCWKVYDKTIESLATPKGHTNSTPPYHCPLPRWVHHYVIPHWTKKTQLLYRDFPAILNINLQPQSVNDFQWLSHALKCLSRVAEKYVTLRSQLANSPYLQTQQRSVCDLHGSGECTMAIDDQKMIRRTAQELGSAGVKGGEGQQEGQRWSELGFVFKWPPSSF